MRNLIIQSVSAVIYDKKNIRFLIIKRICLFVFLLSASINGNSQAIMYIYPDTIDFGLVEYRSEQSRNAIIYNIGDEPLFITNVTSSCGCTVPSWTQEPINPEDSSLIEIRYNTSSIGPFKKAVTIYSSDSINSPKRIIIMGEVVESTGIEYIKDSKERYMISIKNNFIEIRTKTQAFYDKISYQLIGINGKLINQGQIADPSNIYIGNLSNGIYILFLRQKNNEQEFFKFSKF